MNFPLTRRKYIVLIILYCTFVCGFRRAVVLSSHEEGAPHGVTHGGRQRLVGGVGPCQLQRGSCGEPLGKLPRQQKCKCELRFS